jgi:small GTP-binding protein
MLMKRMVEQGLISERLAHIEGEARRKTAYNLTEKGFSAAKEVREKHGDIFTEKLTDIKSIDTQGENRFKKKICILGDPAVGKTALIRRFVHNSFDDKYVSTIGSKVTRKDVVISRAGHDVKVTLMVWDLMGQISYRNITASAFSGAEGALLVADVTRKETLGHLLEWDERLSEVTGRIPTILLANKNDLTEKITIGTEDIKELASKLGSPYYLTSAKNGKNVEQVFNQIANLMVTDEALDSWKEKNITEPDLALIRIIDEILDDFCSKHGGQEAAMQIIQEEAERAHLDMQTPSKGQVEELICGLTSRKGLFATGQDAEYDRKTYLALLEDTEIS